MVEEMPELGPEDDGSNFGLLILLALGIPFVGILYSLFTHVIRQ